MAAERCSGEGSEYDALRGGRIGLEDDSGERASSMRRRRARTFQRTPSDAGNEWRAQANEGRW